MFTQKKICGNQPKIFTQALNPRASKVQIQYNAKGKGKLIVQYNSFDELDGIIEHIK